uniref:Uncharacterized protein n=1 Tax=Anguilla anguilla TaxID=7936 RepID=A0A0E9PU01_ANGAN
MSLADSSPQLQWNFEAMRPLFETFWQILHFESTLFIKCSIPYQYIPEFILYICFTVQIQQNIGSWY